jgi:hypothetical protein
LLYAPQKYVLVDDKIGIDNPAVCFSVGNDRWVLRLETVTVRTVSTICTKNAHYVKNIDSSASNVDIDDYCDAYRDFRLAARTSKDPKTGFPYTPGHYPGFYYWSSAGVLAHESGHLPQLEERARVVVEGKDGVLDEFSQISLPRCDASSAAEAREKMDQKIKDACARIMKTLYLPFDKDLSPTSANRYEKQADQAAAPYYRSLARKIKNKAEAKNWTTERPCGEF